MISTITASLKKLFQTSEEVQVTENIESNTSPVDKDEICSTEKENVCCDPSDKVSAEGQQEDFTPPTIVHEYYEVGADLLAKHKALANLLLTEGLPPCVIFCNTPSDTDLVTVMLKKQGITSRKLIGNIPSRVGAQAIQQLKNGEVSVLVITDISARSVPVEEIELVCNYSIHSDPEVYLHRLGESTRNSKLNKVISLINATDFTNFHYLKKIVDLEFVEKQLPDDSGIAKGKFELLKRQAASETLEIASEITEMVKLLESSSEKQVIIELLLHNTLNVIPSLKPKKSRDDRYNDDPNYDKPSYRNRDSRDRHSRDNRGNRDNRNSRDGRDRNRDRDRKPQYSTPAKKDVRFYIGHGLNHSFSEKELGELISKHISDSECVVQRCQIRDLYTFADYPEEHAEKILNSLSGVARENGDDFFIKKAIAIPLPREEVTEEATSSEETQEHSQSEEVAEDSLQEVE